MKITIYTTPGCVYCKMVKEYFKKRGVSYEEKDVSIDESARDEMIQKSNQMGVPVIDIDGAVVVGFDEQKIGEILK